MSRKIMLETFENNTDTNSNSNRNTNTNKFICHSTLASLQIV